MGSGPGCPPDDGGACRPASGCCRQRGSCGSGRRIVGRGGGRDQLLAGAVAEAMGRVTGPDRSGALRQRKGMTAALMPFVSLLACYPARADTRVPQGLAGAGRGGVSRRCLPPGSGGARLVFPRGGGEPDSGAGRWRKVPEPEDSARRTSGPEAVAAQGVLPLAWRASLGAPGTVRPPWLAPGRQSGPRVTGLAKRPAGQRPPEGADC